MHIIARTFCAGALLAGAAAAHAQSPALGTWHGALVTPGGSLTLVVTIRDGDAAFDLAGVDDHGARSFVGHGEDLHAATLARDPSRALVLLAHQPRQVRRAAKHGVDLQLSGHTHGGQIWPWHYIVRVQQGGLLAGRYTHENTQLYVTRGCGYWGPPVRLLAPLEITRVILRSA